MGTEFQRLSLGGGKAEKELGRRRRTCVKEMKKKIKGGGCLIFFYVLGYNKVK